MGLEPVSCASLRKARQKRVSSSVSVALKSWFVMMPEQSGSLFTGSCQLLVRKRNTILLTNSNCQKESKKTTTHHRTSTSILSIYCTQLKWRQQAPFPPCMNSIPPLILHPHLLQANIWLTSFQIISLHSSPPLLLLRFTWCWRQMNWYCGWCIPKSIFLAAAFQNKRALSWRDCLVSCFKLPYLQWLTSSVVYDTHIINWRQ